MNCAFVIALAVFALAVTGVASAASSQNLVYFDNDFSGPGDTSMQSLVPLIRRSDVRVVGLGVVTGDAWAKEESAHLLRFLEIAGRGDIPVFLGAQMPLLRTPTEVKAWETLYGKLPWLGAFSDAAPGTDFHPGDPAFVPPMPEGRPTLQPSKEDAVSAMIRIVRANPGRVTIIAAGPLTDIALAVRIAPDLPLLAKEIVIEGGEFDNQLAQVTISTDDFTDFNFWFDPEAAHIVLTSPWARATIVGDVTNSVRWTTAIVDRIDSGTPLGAYVKRYVVTGEPFWDEMTAAVAVDRTLVTKELMAVMDVDAAPGADYGRARIWSDQYAPHDGQQRVHIVQAIDGTRFTDEFVAAASRGIGL
jgi:inosine-uridine nucleoside N-ribohydrolase